ncbi:MAG: hypothetical protein ACRBDI_04585 [Alphaproteobacteria bacterium]
MAQNDQNLALLKNNLQMPLIIRDLLLSNTSPAADATYALHEILGNYTAEQAILCAVMTVQEIATFEDIISADLSFLKMECDRLTERYIARNELATDNPDLWEETQKDMMPVIAEDIESFLDLLDLCNLSFEITNPKTAKILNIITTQLQAHLVIIDEVINLLETQSRSMTITISTGINGYQADNIIMFPR